MENGPYILQICKREDSQCMVEDQKRIFMLIGLYESEAGRDKDTEEFYHTLQMEIDQTTKADYLILVGI